MNYALSVVQWSWPQYVEQIIAQDQRRLRNSKFSPLQVLPDSGRWSYLEELAACRKSFAQAPLLAQMPPDDLRRVAGTLAPATERWFGSTGAGRSATVVKQRPQELAEWLDAIPLTGSITPVQIEKYLSGMISVSGISIPTATRLLAMKRPDCCVPVSLSNIAGFRSDSGLGQLCPLPTIWNKQDPKELNSIAHQYASLLQQIWNAPWWQAPPPDDGLEASIWQGRAALLDVLFYDP